MIIAKYVAVVLIGYLLGSIPFGVLICRRSVKTDLRQVGSGKIGTTNVLRVVGKKAAALVLVLDLSKGVLAVLIAGWIIGEGYLTVGGSTLGWSVRGIQSLAAVAALCGHVWSVFLKFRGGRGVATFFGGMAALYPPAAIFGAVVLFAGAFLTRYMSLGSISGAVATYALLVPLAIFKGVPVEYLVYSLVGAIFIIVMHRDNIGRLVSGTERKLGEKVDAKNILSSTHLK